MSRIIESLKQAVGYAQGGKSAGRSTLFFEMPRASAERLMKMVEETGAESGAEVISNALRLYEACLKEMNDGGKVIIRRADGTEIEAMGE